MSKHKLGWTLVAIGIGINLIDAFTAHGDPRAGYFYGDNGVLAGINRNLPVNTGLLIAGVGGGILLFK